MQNRILVLASALLLGCCAAGPPDIAEACPAPKLVASDLKVGDGALDRGFPGGIALVDADGDGDLDVMATRGYDTTQKKVPLKYDRSMLYLNDGRGLFSHALESPLSNADNPASGSTWGDVDNDGDLDVLVGVQHARPDVFFRNIGAGRFEKQELGEATASKVSNFSNSWADVDGDGDLDLYAGGPTLEPGVAVPVFRNDGGVFVEVKDLVISNGKSNPGAALWADVDNDGDQDLLVTNSDIQRKSNMAPADFEAPQLYGNEGGWRFTRTMVQGFDAIGFGGNTAALGDIDNDGDLDLYLGGYARGDFLFRNDGAGRFTHDAAFVAPEHKELAAGGVFADFDLDGDLDLLFENYGTGISLRRNDGTGRFAPVDDPSLAARIASYSGTATGDLDNDGDIDVVIGNWGDTSEGEFATVLTNKSTRCGRPVRIELRNRHGAADPIGARVTLVTDKRRQLREAMGQTGFRAQSGSTFVYGVPAGERIAAAEIRWPDGSTQRATNVAFGRLNVFHQK